MRIAGQIYDIDVFFKTRLTSIVNRRKDDCPYTGIALSAIMISEAHNTSFIRALHNEQL